jgi:eukaryotic-like serine/threonine-protein kinase
MIGETFGNYRLVRQIGSGTMGTVFLGEHERIARRAAIKVLAPELAVATDILGRFFEEARATSLIQHPAIVEVQDCGVHPDGRRPYIAMEYLEGDTLAEHLGRRALGWHEACSIARQMADGLAAAHRHGIVHRDVKPANVMLLGSAPAPGAVAAPRAIKLLDFGVAKLLYEAHSKARTCPGGLVGTPEYMAPEQCGGSGGIDGRTDIYALGCVLFEMICGRLPFQGEMLGDLILAHRWRVAPPASAFAEVPRPLDRLIAAMLAKHPQDRPPDMPQVAHALAELLAPAASTAIITRPSPGGDAPRVRRPPGRRRSGALIAAVGGVAAVIAIGAQLARAGRATRRRNAATPAALRAEPVWAVAPPPPRPVAPAPPPPASVAPPQPSHTAAPSPRVARPAPATRRARSTPGPDIDTDGIVHL